MSRMLVAAAAFSMFGIESALAEPISLAIGAVMSAGSVGAAVAGPSTFAAFGINTALAIGVSTGLSFRAAMLSRRFARRKTP